MAVLPTLLAPLLLVLLIVAVVRLVDTWRTVPDLEPSPAHKALRAARRQWQARGELPPLPHGHRPPVGLGPLSPSERFLAEESGRGLRALQLWLLDQTG